jgi:FKBP-type peptidyl-prolyl cis-trans isomerase SlpA
MRFAFIGANPAQKTLLKLNVPYNRASPRRSTSFMSKAIAPVVTEAAYLTLHYRLATVDGDDIVSTFKDNPATLTLGSGQLAPSLEACLLGLPEGAHQTFELPPEQAFGPRNPELIQRVSRATLKENSQLGEEYSIGDLVEFNAPGGGRFAGVLREIDAEGALFDFNHPLAGQPVKFEVKIIGIL